MRYLAIYLFLFAVTTAPSWASFENEFENKNYDKALRLSYAKALSGEPAATIIVAKILISGLGSAEADLEGALDLVKKNEQKSKQPRLANFLGSLFENNQNGVKANIGQAMKYYRIAEKKGSTRAKGKVTELVPKYYGKFSEEACKIYFSAANSDALKAECIRRSKIEGTPEEELQYWLKAQENDQTIDDIRVIEIGLNDSELFTRYEYDIRTTLANLLKGEQPSIEKALFKTLRKYPLNGKILSTLDKYSEELANEYSMSKLQSGKTVDRCLELAAALDGATVSEAQRLVTQSNEIISDCPAQDAKAAYTIAQTLHRQLRQSTEALKLSQEICDEDASVGACSLGAQILMGRNSQFLGIGEDQKKRQAVELVKKGKLKGDKLAKVYLFDLTIDETPKVAIQEIEPLAKEGYPAAEVRVAEACFKDANIVETMVKLPFKIMTDVLGRNFCEESCQVLARHNASGMLDPISSRKVDVFSKRHCRN